jgi:hypothetical protein
MILAAAPDQDAVLGAAEAASAELRR